MYNARLQTLKLVKASNPTKLRCSNIKLKVKTLSKDNIECKKLSLKMEKQSLRLKKKQSMEL